MATGGKTIERMPALPEELPLDFLKKITNGFSDERQIGTAAFGSINEGILEDGGKIIVLKLTENSPVPSKPKFANEVQNIMVLEHENIAKLIGYCLQQDNKLVQYNNRHIIAEVTETALCYQYFPKGTLDKHIYGESSIDWNTRFKIIKGITRGIQFLHNLPEPVLHLGLNPSNIWLDDNMVPKIAHFGFSRIFGDGQTRKMTQKTDLGTIGYMAPEYLYKGEISARTDIYSLGLIILEIATREKNSSMKEQKDAADYIERVKQDWTKENIIDEYYDSLDEDGVNQVATCISTGLRCVDPDQDKRPRINEIVEVLN